MAEYESQVIEVTGISKETSQDALENYFSSPKRGGEITKIDYNVGSGKAFITFDNAEGAKKALETSPLSLGGCTLTTRRKRVEHMEKDKVYVEGISNQTTGESLMLYVELISGLEVKDIAYGTRGSQTCNAIVTLESSKDFDKMQRGIRRKPKLEGKAISIKEVPQCKTILVKNLPASATHDSVWNKFESRRAGGDEVEEVNLDLEKRIAAVTFKDPSVIERVLSIQQTLDNTTLSVERYFPILGNLADLQNERDSSDPRSADQTTVKPVHSKTTAFTEEIDRDLYVYLKDNHPANLSLALKDPQPNIEIKSETVHFSFSSQEAKEHFLSYLNQYKHEVVPVNPVLLNHGLREDIKELTQIFSTGMSVLFIEKYEEGFIKLVGRASTYDRAIREVNKCIDTVTKRFEEKKSRREDTIEILPVHLKFLQKSTRFQRLENSLKQDGFVMRTDDIKGKITMKGSQAQIQKFKVEIQDIVGRFGERSLNQSRFSFLKTNKALSRIKTLLSTEVLQVEVSVNDQGHVMLHGMDDTQVERAYNVIVDGVGELKLPQTLKMKTSEEALLHELGSSIPLTLHTEDGDPRIICFKKDLRNLRGKVDDFVEREKTVETRVPLTKVVLRYLELHGENILEGSRLSSPGLKIVQAADALVVSGEKTMVENCRASIQHFTRGLKFENMPYGTPETSGSIKGMAAKAIIQTIEKKHQCAILVTTKEETDGPSSFKGPPSSPVLNFNEERKRTLQCRHTYRNGKIIEVHQGDILNHPIDYLVNPANEELKHAGGLAGAIVDRGGRKIQEDSCRAKAHMGLEKLMPGEFVSTDGGKLLCKKILHLVVPKNSSTDGDYGEETKEARYLRYGCNNVMREATDGKTIAIPALGTGIYEIPHAVSAKSLVSTADEFLTENPSHPLQEVHFVDNEPRAIEALMAEMTMHFGNDPNFKISESVRDRWVSSPGKSTVAPLPTPVIPSGDMAFKTPQGMEIRLTVGNIAKSTTDVIVNTVASDLNLTKNPCSKAILDEAGTDITTQCEKWIKQHGQLQDGTFAVTTGAKLKCKKVFHVSCPSYSATNGEKILRQLVQKILAQVQTLSLTSISIPALGTGTLHFPEELVARVLFEEAMKFSSTQKSPLKITRVNIVVYSGNAKAVNTFQEQYHTFASKNIESTSIPKAKRKTLSWFRKQQAKENKSPMEEETHGVKVEIIQGNVVDEATDAIGFLVAEDITQGGQIGEAILKAAGAKLVQEYSKLGKIAADTIVMTSAGNLLARFLLHMVIKRSDNILGTDKSMIQTAVTKCLNHADMCGFTSLSLPAVGTGTLKQNAKQSAEILYGCIKEYRKKENKSLKLIHIVILQENVFEDFKKAFSRKDPTTDSRGTTKTRQRIILEIAADSSSDITKIKAELRKFEAERTLSKKIETDQKLNDRQMAEILELQDQYDVRIECNPEIGFMRISGLPENVAHACDVIRQKIYEWEQERHHLEATVREVQWFYYSGNTDVEIPAKYADSISAKIEKAYHNRLSNASVVVGEDMKYRINFTTMTETCLDSNETMKVYRRPCEAFPLPSHWEYQPIQCSTGVELEVHRVNLDKQDDSTEYKKVQDMFQKTLPNVVIGKIERVQNPRLHQIYEGQKAKMVNGGNEMQLFHGTAKDAVVNINSTGFNRNFCGRNAVRYGRGAYFANKARYSAQNQYATPDLNGWQYVYIARVLVGKYTTGKESLLEPPLIDDKNPSIRYDSVVDNVSNPGIFVIFHDFQAYPEYLVTFKKA